MRPAAILLLTGLLCLVCAAPALAEPPDAAAPAKAKPAPPKKARDDAKAKDADGKEAKDGDGAAKKEGEANPADAEDDRWTQSDLEEVLTKHPSIALTSALLKFVPLLIGLILLVLLYLRRDKIRGGMIPPPLPVTPTVPVSPGQAAMLCVLAFLVIPLVVTMFFPARKNPPLQQTFLTLGIAFLPVAFLIVLRRMRLARPRPPGLLKSTALGAGTFCIAVATVIPVSFIWVAFLLKLGQPPVVQDLVQQTVQPADPMDPYLIGIYGVLVAPFAEEAIFRAMLYPLGRKWLGGTRKAAIISGVVTAGIFAAIHASLTAMVPLFVLALVLTWAFERTNSLAVVVVAHALNNLTSLLPLLMVHWM